MEDLKIEELDLYEILEIELTSTNAEIKKAYRKKALQCHPDKNPNNPNAAKEFHKLTKILEILTDQAAKSAYDKVLKGRKEAAIRHRELDSKRRKLKEDLEAREKIASKNFKDKTADQKLKEEIERLRKEGSKQVEEEMEYVLRQVRQQQMEHSSNDEWDAAKYRIKIKWNAADDKTEEYTYDVLHRFLSKYGNIAALVLSKKKLGSALVEFTTKSAAEMAVELEMGLSTNPIKLEWINGPPPSRRNNKTQSTLIKDSDYESIILTRLRQAEERKRLIEQMKLEDDA